jgi:hypothetical protein
MRSPISFVGCASEAAAACGCCSPGFSCPNTLIIRMRRSWKRRSRGPGNARACILMGIHAGSGLPTVKVLLQPNGATTDDVVWHRVQLDRLAQRGIRSAEQFRRHAITQHRFRVASLLVILTGKKRPAGRSSNAAQLK